MYQYNPLNLKKRFAFLGAESIGPDVAEAIANSAARQGRNIVPKAIKKLLEKATQLDHTGHLQRLSANIFAKGKNAAINAIRNRATVRGGMTREAAKRIAEQAVRQVARQEVSAARAAAERVIQQQATRVATQTAARRATQEAARRAATQQGTRALARTAAQRGTTALARTAAQEAAQIGAQHGARAGSTYLLEAGAVAAGETAAVSAAAMAAAGAAAAVGVGLAGWQGYELYEDIDRGGFVTGFDMDAAAARESADRYSSGNADINNDFTEAQKAMNDELRGASLVARNCASDVISETRTYGNLEGDRERLDGLRTRAIVINRKLEDLMNDPKFEVGSPVYIEAAQAREALKAAINLANNVYENDENADDNNDFYKEAVETKNRADLERIKTSAISNIDAKIALLATLENPGSTNVTHELEELKSEIPSIEKKQDYDQKIAQRLGSLLEEANDLLLVDGTKLTAENAGEIVKLYLARNISSPELRNNPEFINRMMGLVAGLMTPDMTIKEFDAALRSAFANGEFAPNNMVPIGEYFEQVTAANGQPAIKGVKWNLWDPYTVSYLVGLAHRAKNHPALGSSADAYLEEIQNMMNDREWQNKMPKDAKYGGTAFTAYIMRSLQARNLSSPEVFFNYEEKEETVPDSSATDAPRTVGAAVSQTPPVQPRINPATPEKNEQASNAATAAVRSVLAQYIKKGYDALNADELGTWERLSTRVLAGIQNKLKTLNVDNAVDTTVSIAGFNIQLKNGEATLLNPTYGNQWARTVLENLKKNSDSP